MRTEQIFQQAQQFHKQRKLVQAEQLYRKVDELAPHFAEVKHLLGLICSQQGRHEEGVVWVSKAIQKQMGHPPYYNNLGLIYAKMKEWGKASEAYQIATVFAPKFAEAWFNLANANKAQNKMKSAISFYKKAIKLAPEHSKAMYNLANTFLGIGKSKSAREWFEKAITVNPNFVGAHNNLASVLDLWKEHDLALKHYEKVVQLNPNFLNGLKNSGYAHLRHGNYQKARGLLHEYTTKKENSNWDDLLLASLSPVIFKNNEAIDVFQHNLIRKLEEYQTKKLSIDLSQLHEQVLEPPSNIPYQGRAVKKIKSLYGQLFDSSLPQYKISRLRVSNTKKPKIGFVVTHGHEGVFLKCMGGIINQFDTNQFEVFIVYSLPYGQKILQAGITNSNVQFLGIPKEIKQAVEIVAIANFNILHYWEVGTDSMNYFLPFFRLASIQCATWGWPVTTGIPQMDYFISAEGLETPESDEHYTEKLIRFKKLPTYYYRPSLPKKLENIENFGLPTNVPIYLCVQNLRKVHPDFDQLVKTILERDEQGIIVFINDSHSNITKLLRERLEETCQSLASRIHFIERMPSKRYLNLIAKVDVILDTLYYTAGANTAFDAFAVGTPYVTLPWEFHRGRFGAAAYRQIEIEDLIARNEEDYVQKAIQIANDKELRKDISERILSNAHKIFEDLEAVQELESFFLELTEKSSNH